MADTWNRRHIKAQIKTERTQPLKAAGRCRYPAGSPSSPSGEGNGPDLFWIQLPASIDGPLGGANAD